MPTANTHLGLCFWLVPHSLRSANQATALSAIFAIGRIRVSHPKHPRCCSPVHKAAKTIEGARLTPIWQCTTTLRSDQPKLHNHLDAYIEPRCILKTSIIMGSKPREVTCGWSLFTCFSSDHSPRTSTMWVMPALTHSVTSVRTWSDHVASHHNKSWSVTSQSFSTSSQDLNWSF